MIAVLKLLAARFGEPSTYAALAAMLVLVHINVDPGVWQQVTLIGTVAAALLGVLLTEAGRKPAAEVAVDVIQALAKAEASVPGAVVRSTLLCCVLAAGLTLGACSAPERAKVADFNAKVIADLPTSLQMAQAAINLYQIDKGIALVAAAADPALAPLLTAGIALTDPLVAKAQLALNDANADAALVAALANQITAQANVLTAQAAPVVKVVPAS